MAVSAALVKELRERTGLGMMECKRALAETDGDIEVAIENLRKSGQAKAAKKAGRTAAEGAVVVAGEGNYAIMVEVNSETDFVARDEGFLAFANKVAGAAAEAKETDMAKLAELSVDGATIEETRQALIQKIGENIQLRRAVQLEGETVVASYVHGGKIGVLVALKGGDAELGKDVAMHIAAINPMCINEDQVPEETLEQEKRIIREQPDMAGKPDEIVEKMIGGRIKKFLKEITLINQPFVKDPNQTVGALVKAAGAEIQSFVRLEVGEGIEKEEVDFAAEVAAAVKDSQ